MAVFFFLGGSGAVSYIRNKCLQRDSDLSFFFFSPFYHFFFPPTAAINTRGENEWDRRVALKKHVWIQDCEELAAESNDENSPAWGQY